METKNSLTEQEKAAGILTAEVMWKMGRVGGSVLSPDGRTVLYTVTRYDMEQNKGTTDIWSVPAGGGKAVRVTDPGSNESSVQWSADGKKIYFLSDRTGSGQVWSAAPSREQSGSGDRHRGRRGRILGGPFRATGFCISSVCRS